MQVAERNKEGEKVEELSLVAFSHERERETRALCLLLTSGRDCKRWEGGSNGLLESAANGRERGHAHSVADSVCCSQ